MASLQQIAKLCGVSTATVSYVVNDGPRPVKAETKARVQKIIVELGYHPNAHARGLRGMMTHTVGVVFPHVTMPFENTYFGPLLEGIVASNTERQLVTMLFTGFTWEEAERSAAKLCDGRCDGFIVVAPLRNSLLVRDLVSRGVPLVVVGTAPDDSRVSSVDADNVAGGKLATRYLIGLGHLRIGFVAYSCHTTANQERLTGYRLALTDAGIPFDDKLALVLQETEPLAQEQALKGLLNQTKRPTALFCMQDGDAMRSVSIASSMGLSTPDDLSIVGFDDIPSAKDFSPPLTTVRQPVRSTGEKAARLLWDRVSLNKADPVRILNDVLLIPRSSTGPPRTGFASIPRHSSPNAGTLSMEKENETSPSLYIN